MKRLAFRLFLRVNVACGFTGSPLGELTNSQEFSQRLREGP